MGDPCSFLSWLRWYQRINSGAQRLVELRQVCVADDVREEDCGEARDALLDHAPRCGGDHLAASRCPYSNTNGSPNARSTLTMMMETKPMLLNG